MPEDAKGPSPAYVSYGTFKNTIRQLGQHGHLPTRIDASVLKQMSGSARTQFLTAMKFFHLVDKDGTPSPVLKGLAQADDAGWKSMMKPLIERAYPEQTKVFPTGTAKMLEESFGDIGTIRTPAVRFLLAAAKDAEILVNPHILKGAGTRAPRKKRTVEANSNGGTMFDPPPVVQQQPPKSIADALLEKFPTFDPSWPEPQQAAWFTAYGKLLELSGKGAAAK